MHLPASTPYARKLDGGGIEAVNGQTLPDGATVPAAVSARWLVEHRPLNWVDVVHLHHVEFEAIDDLERLLSECRDAGVHVVHTVHDLRAMFGSQEALEERFRLLAKADVEWVTLTPGAAAEVDHVVGSPCHATVVPHGFVVHPDDVVRAERPSQPSTRYLLFGATRPNREQLATVVNWSLAAQPDDSLQLLMRGISPTHLADRDDVYRLIDTARSDSRIEVTMRGYPTDTEITTAAHAADALLLPYLWGTHSGQLELAFDVGLLPVVSRVGFLDQQHERVRDLVEDPIWFNWTDGNPYAFGERLVAALQAVPDRVAQRSRWNREAFAEFRRSEHEEILAAHVAVYEVPA
ncbi:hypothetical protein GCM10027063_24220 [Promicromonospora xylanilytica]